MAFIDFYVDLSRVADALEKIVFLLEKLVYPPATQRAPVQQATLDDLHIVTPEDQMRVQQELQDFGRRHGVMPGSDAMMWALATWEAEQRSIHGEQWEPPEEYRAILAAAQATSQEGPLRERREAPSTAGSRR